MSASADLDRCYRILKEGSKSFAAAAMLLPPRIRPSVAAMYAFCREADDAIDLSPNADEAMAALRERLDRIYGRNPLDNPVDRAFCHVVQRFGLPREILLGLFEGFEWDRQNRTYETIDELLGYAARVASTVGVMMTLLMGRREPRVIARACDLGLAMQLTNICRDVGEDAEAGRIYLPLSWMREEAIEPDRWIRQPVFTPGLARVIARVLDAADDHYRLADLGIRMLPRDSRLAIRSARLIYADIGREIRKNGLDSVSTRAFTTKKRKLWLCLCALDALSWREQPCDQPVHPAARFLVDAIAETGCDKAPAA